MKRVAVLGSTGSIGTSSLEVLNALSDRLTLAGASAHSRWEDLADQTHEFLPPVAVVGNPDLRETVDRSRFHPDTELKFGPDAIARLAGSSDVDVVVTGIVGAAGLESTWAAVESGKTIALANKETLVVAGPLIVGLAARTGSHFLPVDSEHSAIPPALESGQSSEVRRIILSASGGPFRGWSASQLAAATPEDALRHPTWKMGPKISIDSATLMNKALEVIEAKWQFHQNADQIEVVVHPQSLVHSIVEFTDGSCIAQLSPPDMKLPIQYAITWPDRHDGPCPRMDWTQSWSLDFAPPDRDLFPALNLGFEVARRGGTCGAVLYATNEVAVSRFLDGSLKFTEIPQVCREILDAHNFDPAPTLTDLMRLDKWAREETSRWKSSPST